MTTADGGLLTLKGPNLLDAARRLRWFGLSKGVPRTEVDIETAGFKYNMNNVTAVIGRQQLLTIDDAITRPIENGRYFDHAFDDMAGVRPAHGPTDRTPNYWLFHSFFDGRPPVE